ncbi:MAG TPA: DUF3106 domain-containing protein [Pseudoxanthomonas sp.]
MHNSDRAWWAAAALLVLAGAVQALPDTAAESAPASPVKAQAVSGEHESRLQAMAPEQRILFEQRLAAWDALPRAHREDRRARYRAWRELDEGERASLRAIAAQIAAFPPERQQALQTQFAALDDSQRKGWRLGPALGADYEKLHPLLAYVPADQRLPLLAAMRTMDAQQRADLAVLAQRTPPQERQALRMELLALPSAQRAAWLRQKLDQ